MSNQRPEEEFEDSNEFYTFEETNRYNTNSGMYKMQVFLTKIALELIHINSNNKYKILDVGCGTGFSLDYLVNNLNQDKVDLVGVDPSNEMLNITANKGYTTYKLKFEDLKRLNKISSIDYNNYFDVIISISALNWVCTNKGDLELKNVIKKIGVELYNLLKDDGQIVMQFYPGNESVFEIVKSSFYRCKFKVKEFIYNKKSKKKIKYFLILHKN